MPNIATLHPELVHFAIALLVMGVLFRLLAFVVRWPWISPMATTLIVLGTIGAVLSVKSGVDAHGPVERIPGARDAVVEHEDWGIRTRNIFLVVAVLELGALALRGPRERFRKWVAAAAGVVGVFGLYHLYEAGEHGGELVFSYAGGVGTKSGDTADVSRLLLAGLYQQAMLDRREKRSASAAELIDQMARRWPDDLAIRLMAAESKLLDKNDPAAAISAVDAISIPTTDMRSTIRRGYLKADAYVAAGKKDSARVVLEALARDYPDNQRIKDRLSRL
jgi:uncharacterized membrane protein